MRSPLRTDVSALYVDPRGPYQKLLADCWDKARDAREPGTHQCGWFDRVRPTLGKREASRTPLAFAECLIPLAASCSGGLTTTHPDGLR